MSDFNKITVLSLGAGVQSSTLALMAKEGVIDMPDCAIFADTGAEPKAVYDWLDKLESMLPFPVHRVIEKNGLLKSLEENIENGSRFASIPFYAKSPSRAREGMMRRQCTREFKIMPITRKLRELVGLKKGQRSPKDTVLVRQFIGISLDEVVRMKDAKERWIQHEWPLVDMRMSRHDCHLWLEKRGIKNLPKSACSFCPYHSNHEWRYLRDEQPDAWRQAVEVDEAIRHGIKGADDELFLHKDLKPLSEVDLRTDEDMGQMTLFNNECEGMCGV